MPAISDAPTGVGADNAWPLGAGATKQAAVATNDGGTSYIYGVSATQLKQTFTFPAVPSGAVDPFNSVILYGYWNRAVLGSSQVFNAIYNAVVDGTNQNGSLTTGAYVIINPFYTATAGAQRSHAQAGGSHGMSMSGGTSYEVYCTQFLRFIDYTLAAGGFVWLLSLVGSIGANLMLHEMPQLAAYLRGVRDEGGRRQHTLHPHELVAAWREWRDYRHPTFSFA